MDIFEAKMTLRVTGKCYMIIQLFKDLHALPGDYNVILQRPVVTLFPGAGKYKVKNGGQSVSQTKPQSHELFDIYLFNDCLNI